MVEAGLSNRSMSYTATSVEVSLSAYSRTICQEAPAGGFQKEPEVALVLFEGSGGDGVLEAEPELEPPRVRPTPSPTPRAMAMTRRTPQRINQNRFLRGDKQLLGSALDMSTAGYCFPGYAGGWEIQDGDI